MSLRGGMQSPKSSERQGLVFQNKMMFCFHSLVHSASQHCMGENTETLTQRKTACELDEAVSDS